MTSMNFKHIQGVKTKLHPRSGGALRMNDTVDVENTSHIQTIHNKPWKPLCASASRSDEEGVNFTPTKSDTETEGHKASRKGRYALRKDSSSLIANVKFTLRSSLLESPQDIKPPRPLLNGLYMAMKGWLKNFQSQRHSSSMGILSDPISSSFLDLGRLIIQHSLKVMLI